MATPSDKISERFFDNCVAAIIQDNNDSCNYNATSPLHHHHHHQSLRDDQIMMLYALPIIVIAGTVGNALSIAVLLRPCMRYTSVYFYLLILACADTLVLYVSAFKTWIRILTDFEMLHISNATCKIFMFLLLVSMYLSAWLVVLMTADRFIAVWFPFKATVLCSLSKARLATVGLLFITFILNGHVFWTIKLHLPEVDSSVGGLPSRLYCGPEQTSVFMFRPFEYMKLTSYSVVPFLIILCLNISIIIRLRSSASAILQTSSSLSAATDEVQLTYFASTMTSSSRAAGARPILRHTRDPFSQTRITSMLLAVSFTWILLTSPFTLYGILTVGSSFNQNMILRATCFVLMYANHAINFYLYCLTGKKFRRELVELIGRIVVVITCRGRHHRDYHHRQSNSTPQNASPSVRTQKTSHVIELDLPKYSDNRLL